jgi:hypothetical protein
MRIVFFAACFSLISAVSFAQEEAAPDLQLVPIPKETVPEGYAGEVIVQTINCYTNVRSCYGRAYFKNTDGSRYASFRVYYNNGSNGHSNFVLPPGGDHWMTGIRYNDTYASAWGSSGVPDGAQRYWIYVCCN